MKNLSILFIAFLFLQSFLLAQSGWFQQSSGTTQSLYSVFFINEDFGWAAGDYGTILHTSDGGNNWNPQTNVINKHFASIYFINQMIGWVVEREGTILKTTDGGLSWNICFTPTTIISLLSVYFINDTTGWAVGTDCPIPCWAVYCAILKTTDGGLSWNKITSEQGYLHSVYFDDINNGWAVGAYCPEACESVRLMTTDGGVSWVGGSFGGDGLNSVYFINDTIGWAAGESGIIKSIDGGINWNNQPSANGYFFSIHFTSIDTGWAVGENGIIVNTTDGGENWVSLNLGITNQSLHSIYFTDKNNGWFVGESGIIFRTTNGGVSFVEEEEINEIPTKYYLSNNYPNPFNPSTKIKYSIPQTSYVVIKVFDILSDEIETLISEEKPIGTYEITWYAEGLPSGVYFYQLRAGDFIQTKKMILLK